MYSRRSLTVLDGVQYYNGSGAVAEGCSIENAEIHHSVIGLRSQICSGVKIADTIIMGSDYYDPIRCEPGSGTCRSASGPEAISRRHHRQKCPVGSGVIIRPSPAALITTEGNWVVRTALSSSQNTIIPNGTVLSPETTGD